MQSLSFLLHLKKSRDHLVYPKKVLADHAIASASEVVTVQDTTVSGSNLIANI